MWGRSSQTVLIVSKLQLDPPSFLVQPDVRLLRSDFRDGIVELAARERPRLIIEDLDGTPGQGVELCRRLKDDPTTRSIPLILLGVAAEIERNAGFDAIIEKPIVLRQYFETVQRYVNLPVRRGGRHTANLRFTYLHPDGVGQAFSRNLSSYGAFLKTDLLLPEGMHVQVTFRLPGDVHEICCAAIVRSLAPFDPRLSRVGGFGIEFEQLEEADGRRLEKFLARDRRKSFLGF